MKILKYTFLFLLFASAVASLTFYQLIDKHQYLFGRLILGYPEVVISMLSVWCSTIGWLLCELVILDDKRDRVVDAWQTDKINLIDNLHTIEISHDKCVERIKDADKSYYNATVTIRNQESIIEKLTKERDLLKFTTEQQATAIQAKDDKIEKLTQSREAMAFENVRTPIVTSIDLTTPLPSFSNKDKKKPAKKKKK